MLLEHLRLDAGNDKKLVGVTPKLDKNVRAEHAALMVENGLLHLPYDAPWLEPYEQELASFPYGKNDDW